MKNKWYKILRPVQVNTRTRNRLMLKINCDERWIFKRHQAHKTPNVSSGDMYWPNERRYTRRKIRSHEAYSQTDSSGTPWECLLCQKFWTFEHDTLFRQEIARFHLNECKNIYPCGDLANISYFSWMGFTVWKSVLICEAEIRI